MADRDGQREPATPQEIWNILRSVSESQKETDRRLQETDRLITRQAQETDRRMRKLDDLFNGQWGKLMEALVEGDSRRQRRRGGGGRRLREYRDREAYGAAAYLKADESSAAYAERKGLYVIRATGSSASIVNREDFRPRRFGRRDE